MRFAESRALPGRGKLLEGVTHDISSEGIYVLAHGGPLPGTRLRFEVSLPPIPGAPMAMRMKGQGYVTRIDEPTGDQGKPGFSVTIHSFSLRDRIPEAPGLPRIPRLCGSHSGIEVQP